LSAEDAAVAERLRDLMGSKLGRYVSRGQDRAGVQAFYRERKFTPLWIEHNRPLSRAKEAIAFLRGVAADGLEPADYPTPSFADTGPEALAADELRLTNSVLTFARHARTGRVAFSRVSGSVYFDLQFPNAEEILAQLAAAANVRDTLDAYNPQHAAYKALKAKLAEERQRAGEQIVRVPDGPVLRPGMEDARVPILRKRLNLAAIDSRAYDEELIAAVKAFQKKADLYPDGLAGPRTLEKLNGESRMSQVDTIIANMERWRWMPHELSPAYVMVNVPDFRLTVVQNGSTVWSARIVVGKPGRNVPPSIIRNEYLPALQRDPNALARIGLRIGRNADGSLRIYQPPGEKNALGRIRFNFPNRFLVYQHDTPDKHLFEKTMRAYSHGCMRVQNPDYYAEALLSISQPEDGYSAKRIRALYGTGERTISLNNPIPVYITYQTAFVDDAGKLQTRADIYDLDKDIMDTLRDDHRIADVPVARNYSSGSKPITVRMRPRWRDDYGSETHQWGWDTSPRGQRGYRPFSFFRPW
jgi:murein L,D-transpeptidase YcbB/YkuD